MKEIITSGYAANKGMYEKVLRAIKENTALIKTEKCWLQEDNGKKYMYIEYEDIVYRYEYIEEQLGRAI